MKFLLGMICGLCWQSLFQRFGRLTTKIMQKGKRPKDEKNRTNRRDYGEGYCSLVRRKTLHLSSRT